MKNYDVFIKKFYCAEENIKEKFLNLKISTKFIVFYFILFIFSVSLSNLFYQRINSKILEEKIGEVSVQTLNAISSNIDALFGTINNYSKMILSNIDIQEILMHNSEYMKVSGSNKGGYSYFEGSKKVDLLLEGYIEAMPNIASIYLFDNSGNKYAIDRQSVKNIKYKSIEQADWYDFVLKKKGRYIIKVNAGGIFKEDNGTKYISFIRVVNDLQNYQPIGIMIINVSVETIKTTYDKAVSKDDVYIAVFNKDNALIDFENTPFTTEEIINQVNKKDFNSEFIKINKKHFLISTVTSEEEQLKFVSVIPFDGTMNEYKIFDLTAFAIILLNSIMIFVGTVFVSRLITIPIKKLVESMKKVENGELEEVCIQSGSDEIGELRDGYNKMIFEIRNLIEKIKIEQKIKRKIELNILQEQIKPHFLYNSLDAIAYMAAVGNGEMAYDLTIALSNYYRTSLSKGNEVITIENEINIVKNYLTIQKVRFPGLFIEEYDIDESINDMKVIKLILQPIVENSLYHGIRPKGEVGYIKISAKQDDDFILLSVEDNGIGIKKEELEKLKKTKLNNNEESFGLRGTIERLKIFYGIEDIYSIISYEGYGTKIEIRIPKIL